MNIRANEEGATAPGCLIIELSGNPPALTGEMSCATSRLPVSSSIMILAWPGKSAAVTSLLVL